VTEGREASATPIRACFTSMYTTAQLNTIIATLEAGLGQGYATLRQANGSEIVYRSVADIRNAIAYFNALLPSASDAPVPTVPKIRSYIFFGGKGFGI
jgi:hypothetical protein